MNPVNWQELGLHDYLQIVRNPVDLNMVIAKINRSHYKDWKECVRDIRMIWTNCMLYNSFDNKYYVNAKSLSDYFESLLLKHVTERSLIDLERPRNCDELSLLAQLLKKLSPQRLGEALVMLEPEYPTCITKRSNEIEVNFDMISPHAYAKLVNNFSTVGSISDIGLPPVKKRDGRGRKKVIKEVVPDT